MKSKFTKKINLAILGIGFLSLGFINPFSNSFSVLKAETTYTKLELTNKVNAITDAKINSYILIPTLKQNLTDLKAAALEALPSYPNSGSKSDYPAVFSFLDEYEKRMDYYSYQSSTTTVDSTAGFKNFTGSSNGLQRVEDRLQFSFQNQFSKRITSVNKYDATNFDVSFNIGKVPTGNVLAFTVNPVSNPNSYCNEDTQYFHISINNPVATPNKHMVVIGRTPHQTSFDGYKSQSTAAGFSGRFIENNDAGDYIIKVRTDYETGATNVNINNGAIDYTFTNNSVLYKTTQYEQLPCYFSLGMFNGSGQYHEVMYFNISSPEVKKAEFTLGDETDLTINHGLNKSNITSISLNDAAIEQEAYSLNDSSLILKNKYLNTLSADKHSLKINYSKSGVAQEPIVYELTIKEDSNPKPVSLITTSNTIIKTTPSEVVYELNIHGASTSDISIKYNDVVLPSSNYEWRDYNTKFVLTQNYVSSLDYGTYYFTFSRNGVEGESDIKLIIKSQGGSTTTSGGGGGGSSTIWPGTIPLIIGVSVLVIGGIIVGVVLVKKKKTK